MISILFDRFERERQTIRVMTGVYCRGHHEGSRVGGRATRNNPCADCQELLDYAFFRLDKCPFGDTKPTCAKCVVHCYKPVMRERVREVMRYSGPKMVVRHPVLAIFHVIDSRLYKPRRKANPTGTKKVQKSVQIQP